MIKTQSQASNYLTSVSNCGHLLMSDTVKDYGGSNAGFRPHELLEAAFASCLNIWLRMCADKHEIPLTGAQVTVSLERNKTENITFEYCIQLEGSLTEAQREFLYQSAESCPVRLTLSKKAIFQRQGQLADAGESK